MRLVLAIILVFLLQAVCLGKEFDYQSDFTGPELPQIKLDDYLTLSQSRYTTRYEGLQGVLVSRGSRQFRKYQNQYLQNLWGAKNLNICEWARFLQDYEDKSVDFQYGRWWDRSLFDFLPPEKGGVITREVIIGKEVALLTWNDISLTNTGRLRFGKWGFDVSQVNVPSPQTLVSDPSAITRPRDPPFAFRAMIPRGILNSEYVKITTFQNVVLRVSLDPEKILSRVELGVNFKFYAGHPQRQWGNLVIRGRASPFTKYYEANFNFELLCF